MMAFEQYVQHVGIVSRLREYSDFLFSLKFTLCTQLMLPFVVNYKEYYIISCPRSYSSYPSSSQNVLSDMTGVT